MPLLYTKIGATIGPSCATPEIIADMIRGGMTFARLNFSHGTYDDHAKLIAAIRSAAKSAGRHVAIMQDLQGPKLRIGAVPPEGVAVAAGDNVVLCTTKHEYERSGELPLPIAGLEKNIKPGERILIDDGTIATVVVATAPGAITVRVEIGGKVKAHKGLNFPDSSLVGIPALSEKDKNDVSFGVAQGVDLIALSFVKRPRDVVELKSHIASVQRSLGKPIVPVPVIAKIERPEALEDIDRIVEVTDGVLVARGDLGLETPMERLAVEQKAIIEAARRQAKPVMIATHLLASMEHNAIPTRAEISDVGHAVIDRADALLLTNETAVGEHPVSAVRFLAQTARATEQTALDDVVIAGITVPDHHINYSIHEIAELLRSHPLVDRIVAYSVNGKAIRTVAALRLTIPTVAVTSEEPVYALSSVVWGGETLYVPKAWNSRGELERAVMETVRAHTKITKRERILFITDEVFSPDELMAQIKEL